jgi:hypothetical protein
MAWPEGDEDDEDDEDNNDNDVDKSKNDLPKPGDILTKEMIEKISDIGYPISEYGLERFQWMIEEQEKRDQDMHNMYIYNDFSGYGMTELMENLVRLPFLAFRLSLWNAPSQGLWSNKLTIDE